jgi:hypothetical protein
MEMQIAKVMYKNCSLEKTKSYVRKTFVCLWIFSLLKINLLKNVLF